MILLNKMENSEDDQTDMTVGDKLAFIMNAQVKKRDMNQLNEDAFLEWADQFDGAELFLHMQEFVTLYLGSRRTSSKPKKRPPNGAGSKHGGVSPKGEADGTDAV